MEQKAKQKPTFEFLNLLNPLLNECNFLAILAPFTKCLLHKLYALLLQILLIIGFIHSVYGKQSTLFNSYSRTVKIIDQISNLLLSLTIITTIILTIFCFPKKLIKLFKKIAQFDDIMKCLCPARKPIFWVTYGLLHIFVIMTIAFDSWVWLTSVGWTMYKYYFVRNFQYFQLSVTLYLTFWMCMEIYVRFRLLNKVLVKMYRELHKAPYAIMSNTDFPPRKCKLVINKQMQLRDIAKLHGFLCDILNDFNGIFGVIILFSILFYTTYMVQYTVELITYTIINDTINGVSFGVSMLVLCIIWIIECLITLTGLAAAGHFLSSEANRTTAICYNILNDIDGYEGFKDELKLLAQQTFSRNPSLSAFGFFEVNFAMMGFIVTSVTSYIIVAIQFLS